MQHLHKRNTLEAVGMRLTWFNNTKTKRDLKQQEKCVIILKSVEHNLKSSIIGLDLKFSSEVLESDLSAQVTESSTQFPESSSEVTRSSTDFLKLP